MWLRLLLVGLLFCLGSPLQADELAGRVSWIYDGDTLRVEGIGKVRLLGIDTPEQKSSSRDKFYLKNFGLEQRQLRVVARQAKRFNIDLAKGELVKLVTENPSHDPHGRLLAYLYLPDGRMLNQLLLEKGLATVFRRYSFSRKDDFFQAEEQARQARVGLWSD